MPLNEPPYENFLRTPLYLGLVAWGCISSNIKMLPLHMFSFRVNSRLLAGYQRWARIRTGSDCNFFEDWRIRTGSDWEYTFCFNV